MLENLMNEINKRKENGLPYQDLLINMENDIENSTLYDKTQCLHLLAKEYYHVVKDTSLIHIENAIMTVLECFEKNILYRDDYLHFCEMLCELLAMKIRLTKKHELLTDYKEYEIFLSERPDKLFYYCIEVFNKTHSVLYLIDALDYIRQSTLNIVFGCYVSLNIKDTEFLKKLEKIPDMSGYKHYYEIF